MAGLRRLAILRALPALWAVPAAAQDTWGDYSVMTGQGAVLDSMNRENAKRLHKNAGLPPPDFKAAERRVATRRARAMTPAERAHNCALVRANLAKLQPDQLAIYRRACR